MTCSLSALDVYSVHTTSICPLVADDELGMAAMYCGCRGRSWRSAFGPTCSPRMFPFTSSHSMLTPGGTPPSGRAPMPGEMRTAWSLLPYHVGLSPKGACERSLYV